MDQLKNFITSETASLFLFTPKPKTTWKERLEKEMLWASNSSMCVHPRTSGWDRLKASGAQSSCYSTLTVLESHTRGTASDHGWYLESEEARTVRDSADYSQALTHGFLVRAGRVCVFVFLQCWQEAEILELYIKTLRAWRSLPGA